MTPSLSRAWWLMPVLPRTVSVPMAVFTKPLVVDLKKPRMRWPAFLLLGWVDLASSMSEPEVWWAVVGSCWIAASSSSAVAFRGGSAPVARRCASVRSAGWDGGGSSIRGGGGRGALLASPMRRRVIVSWAFVGTPLRSVLWRCGC